MGYRPRSSTCVALLVLLASAALGACRAAPPSAVSAQASTPLHYSERLRGLMQRMNALLYERNQTELEVDKERLERARELASAAATLAVVEIELTWWTLPLLILGEDCCYYWFHRIHHEVRLFWAAHVNHHSSTHYNLSTALRQSWTTPLTGPIFWAPLAVVGFDPAAILVAQSISLIYQFWIHTELIDRMGPLEAILNTPSHHRVHHGRNVRYLDRNYAGIFIFWDRLFGTFEPESERVDYGLTKNIHTFNPVEIAFHEWKAIWRDVRSATSWREAIAYVFEPPGWSPDHSTRTAREMQAELLQSGVGDQTR